MNAGTAISACRRILAESNSSFALAFKILPQEQRNAMTVFYAFCRQVDDVVDAAENSEEAVRAVAAWRSRLKSVFDGNPEGHVCNALRWVVDRFGVERRHLEFVLDGVERDLEVRRYQSFAQLYEYCYRVASAVGLVCVTILGRRSVEIDLYAELTGIAVQLTNIIRDVGEDAGLGRIYLPRDDLLAFGLTDDDILRGRMTLKVKRLLRFEAGRAEHFYGLAESAISKGRRHELFFPEALRETYRRLLIHLIEKDFPVFTTRVKVGKREKIGIALKHRLHPATLVRSHR
ncbi:MAG TPA: squalene/phytoene synthase family protein [Myxococcota bacterium]|nr:squalene/phytoene synthase family protein [Myxococcota bacterium]